MIPETQYPITKLVQILSTTLISLRLAHVVSAVKLHHQEAFRTTEVNDITTNRMLAAELETVHLSGAQAHPELALSVGLTMPQVLSTALEH